MFTFPNKPASILKTITSAFDLYAKTFNKMWYFFLWYWITTIYFPLCYVIGILPIGHKAPTNPLHASPVFIMALMITGSLISLSGFYCKWVAIFRMQKLSEDPNSKIMFALQSVKNKIFIIAGNQILIFIMLLSVVFPLFIPALFLNILLVFSIPLILFNNESATSSIKKSASLVWGKWWQTFAVFFLPLMLAMTLDTLLPYGLQSGFIFKMNRPLQFAAIFLSILNSFFIFPFLWSTLLVKFRDLEIRNSLQ